MMLSLGVVWLVSEYIHPEEDFSEERQEKYKAHHALSRIEMSSIELRGCARHGDQSGGWGSLVMRNYLTNLISSGS